MIRGDAYNSKSEYDRAIADYSQAIRPDPENTIYSRQLGIAKFNKGDFGGAASDLLRAVELKEDPHAMIYRYLARARDGEEGSARAELGVNIGRMQTSAWPKAAAELFLGTRSPESALQAPGTPDNRCEAHFFIAQQDLLMGKPEESKTEFEYAAAACPRTFRMRSGTVRELQRPQGG